MVAGRAVTAHGVCLLHCGVLGCAEPASGGKREHMEVNQNRSCAERRRERKK